MAFNLSLTSRLKNAGWRVKISDKERVEPPHVTIIWKTQRWRLGLRTVEFLDARPDPQAVPSELVDAIRAKLGLLRKTWDEMYPHNPITSEDDDE